MTYYPYGIDDSTSLPPATGPDAISVNANIAATEAIEIELGITPSGIYADVRTRLDILEARINNPFAPAPDVLNPFFIGNTGVTIQAGFGDPNIVLALEPPANGSLFLREDGYSNQGLYSFSDGYWYLVNNTFLPGGDLSGNSTSQTVIGIQGNPVRSGTLGSAQDGYVLTWKNSAKLLEFLPPSNTVVLIGDVTGPVDANTLTKIDGTPLVITSLTTGQGLFYNGTNYVNQLITNANVSATAAIAGTKISPNFGSQNISTTGGLSADATVVTSLQDTAFSSAGVVHNDSSGNFTSSLIVNADVSAAAAIAVNKLAAGTSAQILLNSSTPTPTWTTISGDIGLTNTGVVTVSGILAKTLPALADGYLNYTGSAWQFSTLPSSLPPSGAAGGDLSNTYPNPTVAAIQGNTVTSGALVKGDLFIATSTSNWAATAVTGDVSFSTSTPGLTTVLDIHGASVPVAGALTTGNVLQVSGSSALTYGAVNLAGGSNYIIGNLPIGNVAPGTSAQVLMSNGTPATTWTTISQDVSLSATGVATVESISSTSNIPISGSTTLKSIIFNDGYSGATTTNATLTTIYTGPTIVASSSQDYIVSVVGHDANDGYVYRADFSFTYQRIATASPAVVGASPVALNVRASTGASGWGGASISTSSNNVIVQVQGTSGVTIDWVVSFQAITAT